MQARTRPVYSLRSFLLLLPLLFFFCAAPIAATPGPDTENTQFSTSQRRASVFPQWTWLRDTAIQFWFGAPAATQVEPRKPTSSLSQLSGSPLPSTLLAKYGGNVVLRFNLSTAAEEGALAEAADTLFLDVWEFNNNWADIRLREDDIPSLLGLLPDSLQRAYANLMPDLAKNILQTYPSVAFAQPEPAPLRMDRSSTPSATLSGMSNNIFFQDYRPYSVIVPWMKLMASMFSTHVRMISIGTTYEGREIQALRIGVSPNLGRNGDRQERPTILISGGFHAREWVSVSTVTYIAWSLITSYGKSPAMTKLLQQFDFVLIPTANPDGYIFTWENDRLWRKNRQPTSLRFCRGLDLDRTFGFEWDGTTYQSNPCSESFPGEEPFQAVESHRLAAWAQNETDHNGVRFVGFLDLHSYSQQVLYPYSYSCSADPPSLENLEELGMGLAKAIRISSGEQYSVASACEGATSSRRAKSPSKTQRMETGGGSAIDWFYHEMQVRYSYQIKLRDTGSYGFLLPRENIVPTGEEAFNAVKYFGDFLLGNRGIETALFPEMHHGREEREKAEEEPARIVGVGGDEAMEENGNWELRRKRRR